jgi:hypothetical protein
VECSRLAQRSGQVLAMLMIGDGFLALVQPDRHLRLWKGWSGTLDQWIDALLERPGATRLAGAASVAIGLALAYRQPVDRTQPDEPRAEPSTAATFVIEQEEFVMEAGY